MIFIYNCYGLPNATNKEITGRSVVSHVPSKLWHSQTEVAAKSSVEFNISITLKENNLKFKFLIIKKCIKQKMIT